MSRQPAEVTHRDWLSTSVTAAPFLQPVQPVQNPLHIREGSRYPMCWAAMAATAASLPGAWLTVVTRSVMDVAILIVFVAKERLVFEARQGSPGDLKPEEP